MFSEADLRAARLEQEGAQAQGVAAREEAAREGAEQLWLSLCNGCAQGAQAEAAQQEFVREEVLPAVRFYLAAAETVGNALAVIETGGAALAFLEGRALTGALAAATGGESLFAGSIRGVNAVGGKVNCVSCALATDATLGGHAASAIPGGPFRASDILSHFPGRSFVPANGYSGIRTMMSGYGPGSRGIVWGTRGADVGHMFNVVNQGGAVRFLDGQVGGAASLEAYESMYLLRSY